ncbi:MAG: glycosyl transferase family 1 [Blastopirellula sp.]|nr:MAG: glycosyl transferase family 1 [Blastopirellula sp.]
MHILALEPYYGGSHQTFIDQWIAHSHHQWTLLTLPAHHWKWRMRHAPITLAEQLNHPKYHSQEFDALFCSDMLSLSQFKGLAPANIRNLPAVLYFHENQLTYPDRFKGERDHHYGFDNYLSALAADQVWFNSNYHRQEFLTATRQLLKRMPDYQSLETVDQIEQKSLVAYPGVDQGETDAQSQPVEPSNQPLHILWAARWEHDKNPEDFFAALTLLKQQNIDFRLSVLGESFRDSPKVFAQAKREFADQIIHWGFLESREAYLNALQQADVVVSTALHEFFGIAVVEAIAAGCMPLLPNRLAYPELLEREQDSLAEFYFYDGSPRQLVDRLIEYHSLKNDAPKWESRLHLAQAKVARFQWKQQISQYDGLLDNLIDPKQSL